MTHRDITAQFSNLVDLLQWRGQHQPNRRAYSYLVDGQIEEIQLTYHQLDLQARAIGAKLQAVGASGQRVLLLYPSGLDYIAAFYGCLYAGAVAVPTYPPHRTRPDQRLQLIARDAAAGFILSTADILNEMESRLPQTSALARLHPLATDRLPLAWAEQWRPPQLEPNTLAFLQYTSGSTGNPKGVMINHGNLWHNLGLIQDYFELTPDAPAVSWLPIYHDMGLIGCILEPLYSGLWMILMSPLAFLQRPVRWLQAISRYRAATSGGPNFGYELCARKIKPQQLAGLDLSCWQVAFNGAEPVRAATLNRFAEMFGPVGFQPEAFYPCYGLAEATLIVAGGEKSVLPLVKQVNGTALAQDRVEAVACGGDAQTQSLVSCGRTRHGQQIVIVNPETRQPCLPGQVGEIWAAGDSIAQGYWKRPQESQETFQASLASGPGPFLRTGDLGFVDGELYVTGRLKDLIIIRGANHYPQDIEQTVEGSHPVLRPGCGAAFSVEADGEERLVVVQEVKRTAPGKIDAGLVKADIQEAITRQHKLQAYDIVLLKPTAIPKTSSGKIRRRTCRQAYLEKRLAAIDGEIDEENGQG